MSQPKDVGVAPNDTEARVRRVQEMRLRGAAALVVVEASALDEAVGVERGVARKLGILAQQTDARVVVCGATREQIQALVRVVPTERLEFTDANQPRALGALDLGLVIMRPGVAPGSCLAILTNSGARVPAGCHAFYASPGDPPANTVATRLPGAEGANAVLALYGTALAQERAGYAFRATSAGSAIPDTQELSPSVWDGVRRSVERPAPPQPTAAQPLPDAQQLRELARRAYARLRANVQPNGAVVGSPARGGRPGEPNYWFFWQRDSAAAMARLIALHRHPALDLDTSELAQPVARYLEFIAAIQANGPLGTSRYQVSGKPVLGFGNPQLDGPALTALTLARLDDPARTWPLVKPYLDLLLAPEGQGRTMDAWEFLYGRSFNATLLRRKALLAGARMAGRVGQMDAAARYQAGGRDARDELATFEDTATGRLVASRETLDPWFGAISGLDMAVVSALVAGEPEAATTGATALGAEIDQLAHPAVLATMAALEDAFAPLYRVNQDWRAGGHRGWGLGRFPEDANDGLGSSGGNPWPLATLWGAQFYYRLIGELGAAMGTATHTVVLCDSRQAAFLNRVVDGELVAVDRPISAEVWHERVLPGLAARGDAYLNFVVRHLPDDAGVTEQIDRDTGQPRGAPDLSWALAELIGTIEMHLAL